MVLVGSTNDEHRTPGLNEIECNRMAAGVVKPKQAKCVREDLDRSRAPLCHGYSCPPMSAQPVICGYFGGCWQGGWRLKSAMLGLFQDNP